MFVNSSHSEGLCLSLLEALAHGLPAVVTDVGDSRMALGEPSAGIVVPPGDADALAAAISSLASDPGRRIALGRAARSRFLERFSIERMVSGYQGLYDALARDRRTARSARTND